MIFSGLGFHNGDDINSKVDMAGDAFTRQRQLTYASLQVFGALFFVTMNMFMGNFFNALMVF